MSAAELDAACRKCARVKVSDVGALARVLDDMNIEYTVISSDQCDIYGEINITKLAIGLSAQNCELLSFKERDESLETFYMNLVGGARHE